MRKLQWLTVIAPTLVIAVYVFVGRHGFDRIYDFPAGSFLVVAAGALAAYLFSTAVFRYIGRLQTNLRERHRALSALYAVAAHTASSLDPQQVLDVALQQIMDVMDVESEGIFLADENGGRLQLRAYRSAVPREGLPTCLAGDDCACAQAVATRSPVVLDGPAPRCQSVAGDSPQPKHCISTPIVASDRALGALFVVFGATSALGSQTIDTLVAIGRQIGTALENARLHEATESMAVLQERNRVALELHDGLAQVLGYISVKSEAVQRLSAAGEHHKAQAELSDLRLAAAEAFRDVREAILDLRTSIGPNRSFFDTLREYVRRFNSQNNIPVYLALPDSEEPTFGPTSEVQVLRIIQEALNNVRKHAPGSRVSVSFTTLDDQVRIVVEDDGPGFDLAAVPKGKHLGLQSMEERARSIGGSFQIEANLGKGTKVIVIIPREGQDARTAA